MHPCIDDIIISDEDARLIETWHERTRHISKKVGSSVHWIPPRGHDYIDLTVEYQRKMLICRRCGERKEL